MKFDVKSSDLLRLYNIFNSVFPELNKIYLIMDPYDYILLAKIVCSVFSNNSVLHLDVDDKASMQISYQTLTIDKDILLNVVTVMDEQAILNADGGVHVEFINGLQILHLLERLLLGKKLVVDTNQHFLSLMELKLFSIHKKLDYIYSNKQHSFIDKKSYLKTGDVVRVGDNSGAKFVKIVSEIEPFVYIVTVTKTNLGCDYKFPYGKNYCAILLHPNNEVCLFNYYDGIKEPLFS